MRRLTGVLAVALLFLSTAPTDGDVTAAPASVSDAARSSPPESAAAATGSAEISGTAAGFRDVLGTSPHADSIGALAEAGITAGCAADRYCPRQAVTRDQMASFLVRALDISTGGAAPTPFADVSPQSTHASAIAALAASRITTGCAEGRYCPRQAVTRDQMASFLTRAFDLVLDDGGETSFGDVSPTSPHATAINALAGAGITAGCAPDRFCPRQRVTRDQMASFLARALGLVALPGPAGPPPSTGPAPDDAVLAFVREPSGGCTAECDERTSIWTVRVDGRDPMAMTGPTSAYDRYPRWAPDGDALAFVRTPTGAATGEVHVVDVGHDGASAARQVTSTGAAHSGQGCQAGTMAPVWSPDSRRLAVTCRAGDTPDAASSVYVVGADGSGQTTVPAAAGTGDARPTWSPDSRRLAFTRTNQTVPPGTPNRVAVWTADVSGSSVANPQALVSGAQAADHPRWSPIGDRILYVSVDEATLRPSLRVIGSGGGTPSTVYTAPADQAVQLYATAWSPGGSHIAFPVGDGLTRSVVHVVAAVGGPATPVSPADVLAFAPAWSPSGHVGFDIVPSSDASAGNQLATTGADGTGYRTLAIEGAHAYDAHWFPRGDGP